MFGNTDGRIVDESYRRDPRDGFLTYYDETKYHAHVAARTRIGAGAPIVIVMPGVTYGAGDHTELGAQFKAVYDGTARYIAVGGLGISPTYVDDVAGGIVARHGTRPDRRVIRPRRREHDRARRHDRDRACRRSAAAAPEHAGRATPRSLPGWRPAPGGLLGLPPNLREIANATTGVTYWASSAKAQAALGYRTRNLERGARDAFGHP